ncbi:dynein axonemal heavy chain 1-like [Ranitomeya imitator]|uniref:dynein axonemal heavy chain 1-like n=1 Tax=Ranitomeya imitator TaxID=111125 RepID=UPI0037E8895E
MYNVHGADNGRRPPSSAESRPHWEIPRPQSLVPVSPARISAVLPRKYPVIRQRGFYSDILTYSAAPLVKHVSAGPSVQPNLLRQVDEERNTPKDATASRGGELYLCEERRWMLIPCHGITALSRCFASGMLVCTPHRRDGLYELP